MKKALLWLGPLACLALACLYAYAWFTRDPLVAAFERIEEGMTLESAEALMGRPPHNRGAYIVHDPTTWATLSCTDEAIWYGERDQFVIWSIEGRVVGSSVTHTKESTFEKIYKYACNPSSLWAANSQPFVPPSVPAGFAPVIE
jgi:hypothetical protein